jgi:hypothetical protein
MSSPITSIDYGSSQNYGPYPYTYKQYPSQDNYAKVYTDTLLDEAEKLYNKMVKDFTNKILSDAAAILSQSSLLPSPSSVILSDTQNEYTPQRSAAAYTYTKEEEHTFVQSEFHDDYHKDIGTATGKINISSRDDIQT